LHFWLEEFFFSSSSLKLSHFNVDIWKEKKKGFLFSIFFCSLNRTEKERESSIILPVVLSRSRTYVYAYVCVWFIIITLCSS
jgi:hypothetical protein